MSVNTIPFADSDSLFTVTLDSSASIRTTVTASSTVAAAWISDVLAFHSPRLDSLIVGLDCEWRPNLSSRQQNPIALLQLCVGRRCLLFQLLYSDSVPPQLLAFLSDPRFKFVGVGIDEDVEKLIEDYEISVKNVVDLRTLAVERMGAREVKQMGLKKLAEVVMGVEVKKPKRVTMSRWDQEVLMLDQIGYACVDAFLSFDIGRRLFAGEFAESKKTIPGGRENFVAEAHKGRGADQNIQSSPNQSSPNQSARKGRRAGQNIQSSSNQSSPNQSAHKGRGADQNIQSSPNQSAHKGIGAGQNIQSSTNQRREGTYHSRGNLVRRVGTRGRGYAPAQLWRAPRSSLVTSSGGGTNSIDGASISSNEVQSQLGGNHVFNTSQASNISSMSGVQGFSRFDTMDC